MKRFFLTGTDTDVGKTVVASKILQYFNRQGLSTAGFKPISAGCERTAQGLVNGDALELQQQSSLSMPYEVVNPIAYEPPIAPHIAAAMVGEQITFERLSKGFNQVKAYNADVTLVEGAGGWYLPINDRQYLCDWVAEQQLEVILVVGIKLGCLNHALLTQKVIQSQGLKIAGWVANTLVPETLYIEQNIQSLKNAIAAPLLATVPYLESGMDSLEIDFDFR